MRSVACAEKSLAASLSALVTMSKSMSLWFFCTNLMVTYADILYTSGESYCVLMGLYICSVMLVVVCWGRDG